jgi:hypothetical protein
MLVNQVSFFLLEISPACLAKGVMVVIQMVKREAMGRGTSVVLDRSRRQNLPQLVVQEAVLVVLVVVRVVLVWLVTQAMLVQLVTRVPMAMQDQLGVVQPLVALANQVFRVTVVQLVTKVLMVMQVLTELMPNQVLLAKKG